MVVALKPVPEPKDKKQRLIELEVSQQPAWRAIYANAYTLEKDEQHIIFYFSFQSDHTGASTKVAAASVSTNDIRNQIGNWEKYLQQTAPLVEAAGLFKKPIRGIFSVETIDAANVVQMSRMDMVAEITFSLFVLHDLISWKSNQPKLVAQPKLMVRCSLHLQIDLLFKLFELIKESEEE